MDGPRAPHDTEFANVVHFLDSHLRPGNGWSIQAEYPVAINPNNIGNIRIITDNDKVLSHAVMRPLLVKTAAGLFKAAAIGSVVTSTDCRNRGLSRTILENCLVSAHEHGCDFAILWTDLYDFYRKLGFELGGSEVSGLIEHDFHVDAADLKFLETAKVAADALLRLYQQHTVSSLRTVSEVQQYLQIPNMHVYTAWDQKNTLQAYAVEGKGADLNGYIHEWGGSVPALLALFSHIRRTQGRPITVIAPGHSRNLIRQLQQNGIRINHGFLGMIKILNHDSLFNKIRRYARQVGIDDFILERQGNVTFLGAAGSRFQTDSDADLIRLIFGPQKASQIHKFDKKTSEALETVLPVPMWIWGWDSI